MRGVWNNAKKLFDDMTRLEIPVYAAHAGYFMILALFPMLVLLMGLLRYTGVAVNTLTDALEGVLPTPLLPAARRLILGTYQGTSGMVLSLSALAALWSAGRGIAGLQTGLNAVYHVTEDRGYFTTRLIGTVYTVLFLLLVVLTLVGGVLGQLRRLLLPVAAPALPVLQTGLFVTIYMVLPNRRNRFLAALPGAVLASAGWWGFTQLYSVYVEHFTGYANIYGSVYAVALSMLWLYCCISILLYGGALNFWLQNRKK